MAMGWFPPLRASSLGNPGALSGVVVTSGPLVETAHRVCQGEEGVEEAARTLRAWGLTGQRGPDPHASSPVAVDPGVAKSGFF